ncbi:unnamed protein product [Parajaminaea phylloscopi]
MQQNARTLGAMLEDPAWCAFDERVIWDAWENLTTIRTAGQEWTAGRKFWGHEVSTAVRRRAIKKHCPAPGLEHGCYRAEYGQICKEKQGASLLRSLQQRWGITFALDVPHTRPQVFKCRDMVSTYQCQFHFLARQANDAAYCRPFSYLPDDTDQRFVRPDELTDQVIYRVHTTLSFHGGDAIPAAVAIFLSGTPEAARKCAHAIGLLLAWMASIDRISGAYVLPDGRIAAHHRDNVRLVDWARSRTHGGVNSAIDCDLLEAAVVVNNVVRVAEGDDTADSLLDRIASKLQDANDHQPCVSHLNPYGSIAGRAEAWRRHQDALQYTECLDHYPLAIFDLVKRTIDYACDTVLRQWSKADSATVSIEAAPVDESQR